MNEKFLQYLWNYKMFKHFNFKDVEGKTLEILDFGKWNHNSGPDFSFAKIKINNLIFVGDIELHIKSSDWLMHKHSENRDFNNIILHVVFFHDKDIEFLKNKNIPTLELKNYTDNKLLRKYEELSKENAFIPCEKLFKEDKLSVNFHEENILKKLDTKSVLIEDDLQQNKNNYEAVLFHLMAYTFGLKTNAHIFKQIAENIDFSVIQKTRNNRLQLEAIFFGKAGWPEQCKDEYSKNIKREFDFLKNKFKISDIKFSPKFMRLRPPNFPTLRLSQLAHLYHREQHLFSKIINAKKKKDLYDIFFGISANNYWDSHYIFGKTTDNHHPKILTKAFIDLIIINAILPLKYTYHKHHHETITEEIINIYANINPEKNTITKGWEQLGLKVNNALESQSLIFQHKTFCSAKNCLNCSVSFKIFKSNETTE